MTNFQTFWARILRRNPGFDDTDDTKVTMPISAVRKLAAKAHMDGFNCGVQLTKSLDGFGQNTNSDEDFFNDLFRRVE